MLFKFHNGAMPTAAVLPEVTTGTSIKTMLQLKGVTGLQMKVKAWGVSMDGAAAAAGVQWELIETGTIFGTVTAFVANDVVRWDGDAQHATIADYFSLGTSAGGYTCTAEGSIVASRLFDVQKVQPTGQYAWEFSLGVEPRVTAVSALRIRCHADAAVNANCWVLVEV